MKPVQGKRKSWEGLLLTHIFPMKLDEAWYLPYWSILYFTDHGQRTFREASPPFPLLRRPGPCQGRGLPSGVTRTEEGVGSAISAEQFFEPLLLVPGKLDIVSRTRMDRMSWYLLGDDGKSLGSAKWFGLSERPTNLQPSWWLRRLHTIKQVQIKVN